MQTITPFLWFKEQTAEEAVNVYVSLFQNSKAGDKTYYNAEVAKATGRQEGAVLTVDFELEGQDFVALNGNPEYPFTSAISFFVSCETVEEIDRLWKKLTDGGTVLMELEKYPFSERYGWVQDRFGLSWQLNLASRARKITPCLLFMGAQAGKAEEAIGLYTSIFPNSSIVYLHRYGEGQVHPEGTVQHATFTLNGQEFIAMDSGLEHHTAFSLATSFMVNCETQDEVDLFWERLSEGGEEIECGWLTDAYGVAWQITPIIMNELRKSQDPEISRRAMAAMMTMKKMDIATLKKAVEQSPASP